VIAAKEIGKGKGAEGMPQGMGGPQGYGGEY